MTTYCEKKKSKQPVRQNILPGYARTQRQNSGSSLFIIVCAHYTSYKYIPNDHLKMNFSRTSVMSLPTDTNSQTLQNKNVSLNVTPRFWASSPF